MPDQSTTHDRQRRSGGILLAITRIWVPLVIAVVGLAGIVIGGGQDDVIAGAGVSLVIAALIVWMVNWMYRISVQSNREREEEERARDYFDEHGRWPGE
jgi:ABC-type transport system involved in cytochrome bd biosynthesis fused ATPase/permease subunit